MQKPLENLSDRALDGSQDFKKAHYTAILSDLHLCEAEPVDPVFPLWKKYKTRDFFFDELLAKLLRELEVWSKGEQIELVLNGDIFDFDSVTSFPQAPLFRISKIEKSRGLFPKEEKSLYKIQRILQDHDVFAESLRKWLRSGHRIVFVMGNHDIELHYPAVQRKILELLESPDGTVRFAEWFYISNADTLIEHGNQYDPYCVCEDPINPFVRGSNFRTIRLPFGNLACRYLVNGMGFFNPHVDSNYIMTIPEYVRFFLKYMVRAQPQLMFTWFYGALATLYISMTDRLKPTIKDPLKAEHRIQDIAARANAEPRMVRELRELFVPTAAANPFLMARELWLDRAFLLMAGFVVLLGLMNWIHQLFEVSFLWIFVPLFMLLPFFLFYSKSVVSKVSQFKEPDESTLSKAQAITGVSRIVYGHTHQPRHETIGAVEHLNSGTWSPAFLDVECTKSVEQKTFIWIEPNSQQGHRTAKLMSYRTGEAQTVR
jgi:UDP-2,3-diacylglucosamine pyrophosphatase LpxH